MFRYRLRTLLIVLGIAPPLLAWSSLVGAAVIAHVRALQDDEWIEVGGPGTIAQFPVTCGCTMEPDPDEAMIVSSESAPCVSQSSQ